MTKVTATVIAGKRMNFEIHPLERYFKPPIIVRCPTYPLTKADLFYINPILVGQRLGISWWPRQFPPSNKDKSTILKSLALTVIPAEGKTTPSSVHIAFDAGRSLLLPPHEFKDHFGRCYRDITLKGVGPIKEFVGRNNFLNSADRNGLVSPVEAYKDIARTNILREFGVFVPLGLLIIDTGFRFVGGITNDSSKLWSCKAAIYVRAMTTNTRIFNLINADSNTLVAFMAHELSYIGRIEGEDISDHSKYLKWFAKRMAHQAAKLQRIGYLHDSLHSQQICLDGSICDHDHEFGTGFFTNPKPGDCYVSGGYTIGNQPEILASMIADDRFEDNLWQILRRISKETLPGKDSILECFWNEYDRIYKEWECPSISEKISSYGLDKGDGFLYPIFGEIPIQKESGPKPIAWQIKPNECYSKYNYFKKLFGIKAGRDYKKLLHEYIFNNCTSGDLGFSVNVKGKDVYPNKINIRYQRNFNKNYQGIIELLNILNLPIIFISNFFDDFDWTGCRSLIFGFDVREKTKESRVKLWVDIFNCPSKVQEILSVANINLDNFPFFDIWKSNHHSDILFGFDIFLDGKIGHKTYIPILTGHNRFDSGWKKLLPLCNMIHVSCKDEYIIHFHVQNPVVFLNEIAGMLSSNIKLDFNHCLLNNHFDLKVVSVPHRQLEQGLIKEINLYYR